MESERLQLRFFRQHPSDLLARPPLASSLQSFESSLFFLALGRYPHAFTACVFAIEGAIKAGLAISEENRESLQKLLERARGALPGLANFPRPKADEMRRTRNRIVHHGFGSGDERLSAGLLLGEAIPILGIVYDGFFAFDLCASLMEELGAQLRTALGVYARVRLDPDIDPRRCCDVLAHFIRWSIREPLMTDWEAQAAEDAASYGLMFEMVDRQRQNLRRTLEPSWFFDCPVCAGPQSLVAQLIESRLAMGQITLARAVCADCRLAIPDVPHLADTVCAEEIEEVRSEILRDYGISTSSAVKAGARHEPGSMLRGSVQIAAQAQSDSSKK